MRSAVDTVIGAAQTNIQGQKELAGANPKSGFGQGGGWSWGYATLIGRRHQQQQDGVCEDAVNVRLLASAHSSVSQQSGIHIALADGVSGGACGHVAAEAYVNHCVSWDPSGRYDLHNWIAFKAEQYVAAAVRKHTEKPGASTGTAAWVDAEGFAHVHRIGDCRAYFWSVKANGRIIVQQTMADQTMSYMGYVDAGSPRAEQPSHMVGNGNSGEPEFIKVQLPIAGGLLLCSDGFHEAIQLPKLIDYLHTLNTNLRLHGASYLNIWCNYLARQAQEMGTEDDVSLIVLRKNSAVR